MQSKRAKPKKQAKKPRRVVLGVGHPWFLHSGWAGGRTHVCLTKREAVEDHADVVLKFDDLGHYNRIRLVAEILK